MPASIFRTHEGAFLPTEHARGPWDPQALHGGAPAALMAGALERETPAGLVVTRITVDFLRPVPLAPLTLTTSVVRAGRRVAELAAELTAGGRPVCQARALCLRPAEGAGEQPPQVEPLAGPEQGEPITFSLDGSSAASFAATAMEMRWMQGDRDPGPARVWMRLRHPLVAGQESTPLMSLMAAADFGNGLSAILPFENFVFINADLTVYLHRPPEGRWVCLDSRTDLSAGGAAVAESALYDERGPVGRALQALVVQAR